MKRLSLLFIIMLFPLALFANQVEKIAVFDPSFENSKIDEGSVIAVRELINQTVVNTGAYKLVERSFLERVMQEQQFNNSGAVSDSDATRIGELAGADKIVLSVLTRAQTRLLLSVKLIDVESAQIVGQGTAIFPEMQLFDKVEEVTIKALSYQGGYKGAVKSELKQDSQVTAPQVITSQPVPSQTVSTQTTTVKETKSSSKATKKKVWLKNTPCYKGFVDFGFTLGCIEGDGGGFSATTTHGAQINPYIYVGGGLGIYYNIDFEGAAVPIYADFKVNVLKGRISPVLDMRLGYSAGEISGLYASIMPGCQFGLKGKTALTLSLGYEFFGWGEETKVTHDYDHYYDSWETNYYNRTWQCGGLSVKLALDF